MARSETSVEQTYTMLQEIMSTLLIVKHLDTVIKVLHPESKFIVSVQGS